MYMILSYRPFTNYHRYNRLKSKASETVAMRNADYVRRAAFEFDPDHRSDDDDLPSMPPPNSSFATYGQASTRPIPILHSEPVRSSVTVPSGLLSSVRFSDNGGGDNGDENMGGTQGSYN
jgi:hypothetical protein